MTTSRLEDRLSRACRATSVSRFVPTYGSPSPLVFGGAGQDGTSTAFAAADHIHALPSVDADPFDEIAGTARIYEDFLTPGNTSFFDSDGTLTFGGRGALGETGGVGTVDASTGAGDSFAAVYLAQTSNTWDDRSIEPSRLLTFEARVLLPTMADITDSRVFIGLLRSSASGNIGILGAGVTEGVGFVLDGGNWNAYVVNSSTATTVDLGTAPRFTGPDGLFDTFRIDYDPSAEAGSRLRFRIIKTDGTALADEFVSEDNFPTQQIAGIGAFIEDETGAVRIVSIDYIFIELDRDLS